MKSLNRRSRSSQRGVLLPASGGNTFTLRGLSVLLFKFFSSPNPDPNSMDSSRFEQKITKLTKRNLYYPPPAEIPLPFVVLVCFCSNSFLLRILTSKREPGRHCSNRRLAGMACKMPPRRRLLQPSDNSGHRLSAFAPQGGGYIIAAIGANPMPRRRSRRALPLPASSYPLTVRRTCRRSRSGA